MNPFTVTVLGNGSAVPTSFQNPSAQLVTYGSKRFLVDCGEGTQMRMIDFKTGHRHLNHIFISHLHGDHFFGLIGLLNTLHLYGRKQPLNIYAPEDLKQVIEIQLEVSKSNLSYSLLFHNLGQNFSEPLYTDKNLEVFHFSLKHRIPTFGFIFKEKLGDRKLKRSFIDEFNPSIEQMHVVKSGADYEAEDGRRISNMEVTNDPYPPRSYAYCSDTAYFEKVIPFIQGVDLLYHEATFDNEQEQKAMDKFHSTAAQAALIAKKAHAGKLMLGHFSARFKEKDHLLAEAKEVFPATILSEEGKTYEV
ncbi:MAG: ribonuclease Z [Bacteroidetes bacterium]|nr:MAG: ribonuclease Z [Bacteroidota bacterium]